MNPKAPHRLPRNNQDRPWLSTPGTALARYATTFRPNLLFQEWSDIIKKPV